MPYSVSRASPPPSSVTISSIEEPTHDLAKVVVAKAYESLGIHAKFENLPGRRALIWANVGHTDGDLARIKGTESLYNNLIRIDSPVINIKGVVFTRKVKRNIEKWSDLEGLSIGIIAGIRYAEIGTKKYNPVRTENITQLFRLLANDRIDVAISVKNSGLIEIHRKFPNAGIFMTGKPLFVAPLFHFVHKRHKGLVPTLENALREMHSNGEFQNLIEHKLEMMLGS